ncbi:MAG: hypothetical protein ABIO70_03290 [Pseudomonadota bacterium]
MPRWSRRTLPLAALLIAGAAMADEPRDTTARWQPPRVAGALDILPGEHRPFQLIVDPVSWDHGAWNLGPSLALSTPIVLDDGAHIAGWQLHLGAWWMPGERVRWRVGTEAGLALRSLYSSDEELARDWTPTLGARAGLAFPVLGSWRLEPGLRLLAELPSATLQNGGRTVDLPLWHLQILLGLHLPSPGHRD